MLAAGLRSSRTVGREKKRSEGGGALLEEGVINEPLALNEVTVTGQAALCTACNL